MSRKNIFAIAAIAFVALMLSIRLWAGDERQALYAVIQVEQAPDGRVYVVLGDRLFIENPDGTADRMVPLARLGVEQFHGDLAVLSDGSVILARGRMPELTGEEATLATAGLATPDNSPSDTLMRCSLDSYKCTDLDGGGTPARLGRTFMLAVDEAASRIVVADTSRHRVLLLDLEGRVLSRDVRSFRFPNQVLRAAPGEMVIADSWHNRLVSVRIDGDRLSEPEVVATTDCWPGSAVRAAPTGYQVLPGGSRWAVAGLDLSFRAGLYRLDTECAEAIETAPSSDLLYLSASGDSLLVPDAEHLRIWRFDAYAMALPDFGSPELAAALDADRAHKRWITGVFDYSLWLLLAAAVPMIVIGRRIDAEEKATTIPVPAANPVQAPSVQDEPEPAADFVALRRESVFRPRLLPLDTRMAAWLYAGVGAMAATIIYAIVAGTAADERWAGVLPLLGSMNAVLAGAAVVAALILAVVIALRSERLVIDSVGIHYTAPPHAPGRAWSMRWSDVARVELRHIRSGTNAEHWFYVVTDKHGTARATPALYWRLDGRRDAGTRLVGADAGIHRAAIERTALYGALRLDAPARGTESRVDGPVIELVLIPPRYSQAMRWRLVLSISLITVWIAAYLWMRIDLSWPPDLGGIAERLQAAYETKPWMLAMTIGVLLAVPVTYRSLKRARIRISPDAIEFDSGFPIKLPGTHWRVPRATIESIELATTSPRMPAGYRLRVRAGNQTRTLPPLQWFRLDRDIEQQPLPPMRLFYFRADAVRAIARACPFVTALQDAGYTVDDLTGAPDTVFGRA